MVYEYRLDRNLSTKGRTAVYSKNERTWSVDFIIDFFSSSNFGFVLGDSSNFDDYEEEPRKKHRFAFFESFQVFLFSSNRHNGEIWQRI